MLKVETWPIEKLIPYARNPRINDSAVPKLAGLIKEFGFKVPLVIKSDGEIIDGHERYKAAQLLGLKEVPVTIADEWTPTQVKAFRLAVNKSAEWAQWDNELLNLELEELKKDNFDLGLIDFEDKDFGDINKFEPELESDSESYEDPNKELKDFEKSDEELLGQNKLIIVYKTNEEMFIRKLLHLESNEKISMLYNAFDLAKKY